jgi:enoyl-CoA hydratase
MAFNTLRYDVDGDGIALITINRPDRLNSLSVETLDEIDHCFTEAATDSNVRAVVITGAGDKSFAAGADISEFKDLGGIEGHRFAHRGQEVFNRIEAMEKPVVAAVNGYALGGGCELALACHLRTAVEDASFGQPEVNLGIIPGFGGSQRLPRIVGRGIAMEMILTADRISARRAFEIGLVNRIYPAGTLLDGTKDFVRKIVSKAPLALAMALEAVRSSDLPLSEGLRYEASLFGQCCATEDFTEGVDAFLQRREPKFKGQ